MANLVIVAIPEQDDYVWKISSEKVPHLTILFLGEATENPHVSRISEFLEHAASTVLNRFWLDVDRRGTLGEDEADVLFFDGWDLPELKHFRSQLLQNDDIRKAYESTKQFPEWQPHLTLGYPDTPAKKIPNRDEKIYSVNFDRVALWFGDYQGPEFVLKKHKYADPEYPMDLSMSDVKKFPSVDEVLSHYGVKGMRWGMRRSAPTAKVTVTQKGKKLRSAGGEGRKASSDAVRAQTIKQVKKKSGIKALSDDELRSYSNRLQLEQQVKRLEFESKPAAKKFVSKLLGQQGSIAANQVATQATTKAVKKSLAKTALAAA